MITAVLDRRAGAPLGKHDIYLSTVGGVRVTEPASDLAVALALASSLRDQPLPAGTVALGEVGLAGEVRPATGVARRIAEAARLGFTRALVPPGVRGASPSRTGSPWSRYPTWPARSAPLSGVAGARITAGHGAKGESPDLAREQDRR